MSELTVGASSLARNALGGAEFALGHTCGPIDAYAPHPSSFNATMGSWLSLLHRAQGSSG